MKPQFMNSKGQGLALNTIVIAILVIIVLLVIIVFFTTQVGQTGDQLDQNSASQCNFNNPAISTLYSEDTHSVKPLEEEMDSCADVSGGDYSSVTGVSDCCVAETTSSN